MLLLRADASRSIGTGHAMRCLALAQAWKDSGGTAVFALAEASDGVLERLSDEALPVEAIAARPGSPEDAAAAAAVSRRIGARWIVLDGYRFDARYRERARSAGARLMVIDDLGDGGPWSSADVILNQNPHASKAMYATRRPGAELLLGPRWALLRREFVSIRRERPVLARAERVVVAFGGADPAEMSPRAARALAGLGLQVTVVIGLAQEGATRASGPALEGVEYLVRPRDFPRLLAETDLAVIAAGTTCWEACLLGVPILAVATAPNQVPIAAAVTRLGAAKDLGWHESLSEERLREEVRALAVDRRRRSAMAEAGMRLVDGLGARRVVDLLRSAAAETA